MSMPGGMYVPRFVIRQRITAMVNRYEIHAADPDGSEGALLAFAEQKRLRLKEEIVFFADESKSRPVFSSGQAMSGCAWAVLISERHRAARDRYTGTAAILRWSDQRYGS